MCKTVHVISVEMADARGAEGLQVVGTSQCRVKSEPKFTGLCLTGLAGVTVEDSYENNELVYTTTVRFQTRDKTPMAARKMVLRLTGADGRRYMIGTGSRPYPVIKESNPFPEKPADSSLKSVTVTWRSLLPMLHIIE